MRNNDTTDALNKQIGSRIRDARVAAGMSRERLGELLHITHQQIAKYESGENRVAASRLEHVSQATGQHIWFFFDDGNYEMNRHRNNKSHDRLYIDIVNKLRTIDDLDVSRNLNKFLSSVIEAKT